MLGLSIAIDAGVSLLQTIELKIPFLASAKPLQALDPIKDGAKRLTDILLLATGSLFLQNILLKITSGTIFKWGFLAIAALTVASLLLAQSNRVRIAFATSLGVSHVTLARFQGFLIKTFIVATIVRFIVPTFAIASLLVSQALVAPEIRQDAEALERHEKSLSEMEAQFSEARDEVSKEQESREEILSHDEAEDSVPDKETEPTLSPSAQPVFRPAEDLRVLREQKVQLEKTLASLESEKQQLSDGISERQSSGWKGWIPEFADKSDEALAEANTRVEQIESEIAREESEVACIDQSTTGNNCKSYLAEHGKQALGEFKIQLESEQRELQKRLQSLQEVREKIKAETTGEAEGETGGRDKIAGALPRLLGEDSAEEVEAVQPTVEDIDREVAEATTLKRQSALGLTCVDRRMAGKHCDSPAVDDHVQSALDSLKERLQSDLRGLRDELNSREEERNRLAELERFKAERRQIEGEIEENRKLIKRNESDMECAERRVDGKDCDSDTIVDGIRQLGTTTGDIISRTTEAAGKKLSGAGQAFRDMLDRFKTLVDDTKDMVERMFPLLILKVIENIVLPIIFLAIALKVSVPIARSLMKVSTTIKEDTREALSAMDRALPSRKG